jgi:integrase
MTRRRRKSYEIPVDEALRRLPKNAQLAMTVQAATTGVVDIVGPITKPHERFRTQRGELITYRDGIYLRYYAASKGGTRMKVAEPLCPLGTAEKDVLKAQRKRMAVVNLEQRSQFFAPKADEMTVAMFWDALYWPFIRENLKPKSVESYGHIWRAYLEPHFRKKSLERYTTGNAHDFLESLAMLKNKNGEKRLGRNTINLCRSICYGIFKRAKNKSLRDDNPWEDVEVEVKVRRPEPLVTYNFAEVAKVVKEIPDTEAKLLFAFCSLFGMSPSEAAGVMWEDIDPVKKTLHLSRNAPGGIVQDTMKTTNRERDYDLDNSVGWLIEEYRMELIETGKKPTGFLFKRRNGSSVINVDDWAPYHIGRFGKRAIGDRWAGLYPGRRGVGTGAYNLTGDARASFQMLGNKKGYNYISPSTEQGKAGSRAIDAAYKEEVKKLAQ